MSINSGSLKSITTEYIKYKYDSNTCIRIEIPLKISDVSHYILVKKNI